MIAEKLKAMQYIESCFALDGHHSALAFEQRVSFWHEIPQCAFWCSACTLRISGIINY